MRPLWQVAQPERLTGSPDSVTLVSAVMSFLTLSSPQFITGKLRLPESWNPEWLNPSSWHLNLQLVCALISIWTLGFKLRWDSVPIPHFPKGPVTHGPTMLRIPGCQPEHVRTTVVMSNQRETLPWPIYCTWKLRLLSLIATYCSTMCHRCEKCCPS